MSHIKKIYWIPFFIAFGISMFVKPAFCFLLIGSAAFCIGIYAVIFLKRIQEKGIACTGKILSYETGSEGYKTPVVEFTPLGGAPITGTPFVYASTDLSKIRSYKKQIDQEVLISYDPDDPKKFILSQEKGFNYFFLVIVILFGSIFIVVGLCSLLGYIKLA